MTKLFNAFSIQMVAYLGESDIHTRPMTRIETVQKLADGFESYIGHPDTAAVLSNMLGVKVECHRAFGRLDKGESAIVAQVIGGRLPAGATELPEGMEIRFYEVEVR